MILNELNFKKPQHVLNFEDIKKVVDRNLK